jgi:hypothetical protein
MPWEVVATEEFEGWFLALSPEDAREVAARVDYIEAKGPNAKRPVVGSIKGSDHDPRMKELRCGTRGAIRVLFVFDPQRRAVLLVGGAKAGQWNAWYDEMIPVADRVYAEYLRETGQR